MDGWKTWWATRARLGGRVHADELRAAVEALLEAGTLLELWLQPRGMENAMHVLWTPNATQALPRPIIRAHGREDLIARELRRCADGTWRVAGY
jgi:hypothetical protein